MKTEIHTTVDSALAAIGSKTMFTGAGVTVGAGIVSSDVGVLVGIVLGVVGLLVNWYYRARQDRREQAAHDKRMGEK